MEQLNSLVTFNNSSPGHPSQDSWISIHLVPTLVLSICFLLGVPGNISVIILKPKWQHLSSVSHSLMLNLSISDLMCLLPPPLLINTFLYSWNLGLVACKLLPYVIYCSMNCSLLTVTVLSVQRCLQVVYLKRWFDQVGKWNLLVLLWLFAMILSIPALVLQQVTTDQNWTYCTRTSSSSAQLSAALLAESLIGFISISVMHLHTSEEEGKQAAFFNNPQTTRLVTSIIVTFFVLWLPYHITNVLGVAAILFESEGLWNFCIDSWDIVGALVIVNSCLNPLLYAFASRNMCTVCQEREH